MFTNDGMRVFLARPTRPPALEILDKHAPVYRTQAVAFGNVFDSDQLRHWFALASLLDRISEVFFNLVEDSDSDEENSQGYHS